MNIHYFFGQHRTAAQAREIGLPIHSKKGTQPPRSRVGLTVNASHGHNVYPGGKRLRKAMHKLTQRKAGYVTMRDNCAQVKTLGEGCVTEPGSMSA